MNSSKRFGFWVLMIGLIIPRLPFMFAPDFLPDIDESAIGIHLNKWLSGIRVPWYFPGQTHNFILPEMLVTAPFIKLLGPTSLALKLPVFLFFLLGMGLLYFVGLKRFQPLKIALILIILGAFPPILVWSMKLRGGYIPAFAFSCLLLWILDKKFLRFYHLIIIGFLLMLIWKSHNLCFIFMMIPVVYAAFRRTWELRNLFPIGIGAILMWLLTFIPIPPNNLFPADTSRLFAEGIHFSAPVFSDLLRFSSGQWLLWYIPEHHWVFYIFLPFMIFFVYYLFKNEGSHRIFLTVLLGGFFTLYYFFQPFPLRYILPVFFGLIIFAPKILPEFKQRVLILIATLFLAVPYFKPFFHTHLDFDMASEKKLKSLIESHLDQEMKVVFCEDENLTYMLNFFADEKVLYRSKPPYSRFQSDWYDAESALLHRENVGLLCYHSQIGDQRGIPVSKEWFWYPEIKIQWLDLMDFELKEL
ncbi:MAG: hypothetical protein JJU02_11885 [Cryomorphaceae bacterium]|nr:hypothetical protein [Cryomorphaceae bacterium]